MKLFDYLGAKLVLLELQNSSKVKRDVVDESRLLLGDVYFEQEFYAEAEKEYRSTAESAKKKWIKAKAYFQMGQSQLKTQDYFEAINSFKMALKHSFDKQFKFEAELNLGRALKLAGNYQKATKICRGLLENESVKDKHGLVKLELADCIYREGKSLFKKLKDADVSYRGKIEEALDEYKKITSEYKRTEVSAQAYFQMGKIYEDEFGDFSKAKENYEKVRREFIRSKLVELANQKARSLGKLIQLKNLVSKTQGLRRSDDSDMTHQLTEMEMLLLEQGVHPELRFLRKKRKIAQFAQLSQAEKETQNASARNVNTGQKTSVDEIVASKLQLAELYLFQFAQYDSAIQEYEEILELFPNHSAGAKALYSLAFIYENEYQDKIKTDSLLLELVKRYQGSYQAQEARKKLGLPIVFEQTDQAAVLFKKAEDTLFKEKNVHKAIREYQKIVNTYPGSEYAPKSLYAVGWIYEQIKNQNDKAYEIYQEIVDKYPNTDFSKKVQKKIKAVQRLAAEKSRKQDETNNVERTNQTDNITKSDSKSKQQQVSDKQQPVDKTSDSKRPQLDEADKQKKEKPKP
jgi:tetratricopeptide (TPR) repeat protein